MELGKNFKKALDKPVLKIKLPWGKSKAEKKRLAQEEEDAESLRRAEKFATERSEGHMSEQAPTPQPIDDFSFLDDKKPDTNNTANPTPENIDARISSLPPIDNTEAERLTRARDYRNLSEVQGDKWESFSKINLPLQEKEKKEKPVPKTPEEQEVEKEIKQEIKKLPEKDRKNMEIGLNTLGFLVEKKKNDFFAKTFDLIGKGFLNKKSTTARFCKELQDSFARDAKIAEKKAEDVISGKEKHRLSNAGLLFGNVVRYGRVVTDLTGASLASPLRYVMMGGMAFTRASEAGKEARLKNEEVIEKTRITDADQAAEEAWAIYENAQLKEETKNVSAEALKDAYMMEMPENIWKRLEQPAVANNMIQKIIRKEVELKMGFMLGRMDIIDKNKKLSLIEKKQKKEALTKKYEKKLRDYDRIITQYGTVDELAMAGRYAQTVGKAVVAVVTVETLLLSVEKLWGALSHVLSSPDIQDVPPPVRGGQDIQLPNENVATPPTPVTADAPLPDAMPKSTPADADSNAFSNSFPKKDPWGNAFNKPKTPWEKIKFGEASGITPDTTPLPSVEDITKEVFTFDKGKGGIQGILDLKNQIRTDYPDISKAPEGVQEFMKETNVTKQAMEFGFFDPNNPNESAMILKGSTLKFDEQGNLTFHDARTGKDITKYSGRMFDSDKSGQVPRTAGVEKPLNEENTFTKNFKSAGERQKEIFSKIKFGETPPELTPDTVSEPAQDAVPEPATTEALTEKIKAQMDAAEKPSDIVHAYGSPMERGGVHEKGWVNAYNQPQHDEYGRPVGYSGEGGEFFADLSPSENNILLTHPEFAENPFHLTGEKLMEAYSIHEDNIEKIFPVNTAQAWHSIEDLKAEKILDQKIPDNAFSSYIHKLQEVSGLEPKGGLIRRAETVGHYVARALQKVIKDGTLEEVEKSIRK